MDKNTADISELALELIQSFMGDKSIQPDFTKQKNMKLPNIRTEKMKSLREEIFGEKEETHQWIRIHNRRFKLDQIEFYSMHMNGTDRFLDVSLRNGKDVQTIFEKEDKEEAGRIMKVLDDYFVPLDTTLPDANYF